MFAFQQKQSRHIFTAALLLLVTAGLFVKAFVPAGFMPETKDGMIAMVICSGMGDKTVYVPASDIPSDQTPAHEPAQELCAWQILTGQQVIASADFPLLILPPQQDIHYTWPSANKVLSHRDPPFAARGPPSA